METGLPPTIITLSGCVEICKKAADVYRHPASGYFPSFKKTVRPLPRNSFITSKYGYLGIRIFCPT